MEVKKLKKLKKKKLKLKKKELKKPELYARKGMKIIKCLSCGEDMVVDREAKKAKCSKCTQLMLYGKVEIGWD